MFSVILMLLSLAQGQNPTATSSKPAKTASSVSSKPATKSTKRTGAEASAPKVPAGPKTAAELQQDLTAALKAAPLEGDGVNISVEPGQISLTGVVHEAEHKGVATRIARAMAIKDGWNNTHVLNHLDVQPTHQN